MHWYNILTIAVSVGSLAASCVVGWLSYRGALAGVAQTITAQSHEWSAEHARWLREKRADVYEATIADITKRSALRWDGVKNRPKSDDLSRLDKLLRTVEPPAELRARLQLYGSPDACALANESDAAHATATFDFTAWASAIVRADEIHKTKATDDMQRETTDAERDCVRKMSVALAEADKSDSRMLELLADEIARPFQPGSERMAIAESPVPLVRATPPPRPQVEL